MKKSELYNIIKKTVQEYTGTGASGGNAGDGNNITSPRPYYSDEKEREEYMKKNVYGGEGEHYRKDSDNFNYNRTKMGMFEKKKKTNITDQAYGHATLTTQGQYKSRFTKTGRPPGIMEDKPKNVKEQLTQDEMQSYNRKKAGYQRKIADIDIEIAEKNKEAISNQLQQQTSALGPQLDAVEKQLYDINQTIRSKKNERIKIKRNLKKSSEAFNEIDPIDEEARLAALETLQALEISLETIENEINQLKGQRQGITQQRDGILKQRSQAQAASSAAMQQADQGIRSQRSARDKIKETMQENLLNQYLKERKNVNLMEQIDSYKESTRGSLKKIFKMFKEGKTNEEVMQYYAKKGIQIPETYIGKAKKQYESYEKLKLELGFMEQEAKDFKKPVDSFQEEEKQLSTKIFKK